MKISKNQEAFNEKYKDLNATTDDFKNVMEEVYGRDLTVFFEQWLYKPGILKLKGDWSFNKKEREVIINLNQEQTDGSLFVMPIEISIDFGNKKQQIELIEIKGKSNSYKLKVEGEPKNISLDPNLWVLMNADFKKSQISKKPWKQ